MTAKQMDLFEEIAVQADALKKERDKSGPLAQLLKQRMFNLTMNPIFDKNLYTEYITTTRGKS